MLDLQIRLQNLHVRHAVVGAGTEVGTTLSFLLRRFSFALFVRSSSRCSTPALTVVFHDDLFPASWFHVLWLMLHFFRLRLQVSLNLSFERPRFLLPDVSSPYSSCFGRRWSSMRCTCPSYRSLRLHRIEGIDILPACWRTTTLVILSCHLIPRIFLRHLR